MSKQLAVLSVLAFVLGGFASQAHADTEVTFWFAGDTKAHHGWTHLFTDAATGATAFATAGELTSANFDVSALFAEVEDFSIGQTRRGLGVRHEGEGPALSNRLNSSAELTEALRFDFDLAGGSGARVNAIAFLGMVDGGDEAFNVYDADGNALAFSYNDRLLTFAQPVNSDSIFLSIDPSHAGDGIKVRWISVTFAPLPASVWMGLAMVGALGVHRLVRRGRIAI